MTTWEEKNDLLLHLGEHPKEHLGAVVPPIFQNSLFVLYEEGEEGDGGYTYSRGANPTVEAVEQKLAALEETEDAVVTASGMSAITSAILHYVKAGDHVVCIRSCYGGTFAFLDEYLRRFQVSCTFVHGDFEDYVQETRENTTLFYLESPSTAIFKLQDLRRITAFAKERGIRTVIDNTWSTPMYQNPHSLGVDLCVHSMSKYLGGHSDVVAGCIMGDHADIQAIRDQERSLLGGCLDPHAAWLLLRGMRTLALRAARVAENARQVAALLESAPQTGQVFWPGLPSHPDHALAEAQMSGYTGLMSFRLPGGQERRTRFIRNLRVIQHGCSWGGFESLVFDFGSQGEETARLHDWYPDLIRLYVGMEDAGTLIEDLRQALEA